MALVTAQLTKQVAAIFDFDGTLIDGYSAMSVYQQRLKSRQIGPAEFLRMSALTMQGIVGEVDATAYISAAAKAFAGKTEDELDSFGRSITRSALGGWLYPEAVELIRSHRRRGHLIVIATSALPFQVETLARELEADVVLSTKLRFENGACTGDIDGDVLWGRAKADAVREAAAAHGFDLRGSFGYANGDEDIEFLELVGNPTAVNAGKGLAARAEELGWPTASFASRRRGSLQDGPRTAIAYGGLAASCLLGAAVGALNRSRRVTANTVSAVGGEVTLSLAGVDLNVVGEENLWNSRPAVFITNHQSNLDAIILFKLVRQDFTTIAKKEISSKPVLAQFMWLINAALVDRSDVGKARAAMAPAVARLAEGTSIVVAPEGTRSLTSRVGPFKKGPFHLALQGGVPIVPIIMRNTCELNWRGSRTIRAGVVDVAVLPAIDVSSWRLDELDDRVAEVRDLYVRALADWSCVGDLVAGVRPAPDVRPAPSRSRRPSRATTTTSEGSGHEQQLV
jgi:putative phosphoserine phosphatase/1-acylglycerol-3-phosphate O-acyltransferase